MVTASINTLSTVPTIVAQYGGDGVVNSGVTASLVNTNTDVQGPGSYTSFGGSITVQNNQTVWTDIFISHSNPQSWIGSAGCRLFDTVSNTQIGDAITVNSGSKNLTIKLKNTSGTAWVLRAQGYVTGAASYYSLFTAQHYGSTVFVDSDFAKWEEIKPSSTSARHRKYYVENLYVLVPYSSSNCTVDGIATLQYTGIKVIPINTLITRMDFLGSGTALVAITGKGFNVQ